jgi:hypothetical protein
MDTNTESKATATEPMREAHQSADGRMKETGSKVISVKTAITVAVVIILASLAFYYKGLFIVATVNGSPVSRFAVIAELEKASGGKALDAIITKKLLNDEAKKKGITVTSDELNAEIKKVEDQIKVRGGTLDAALSQQGMTRKDVEEQITLQKELEKLLADKIQVTDEEAANFLADNKVIVPKGEEEKYKAQAKEQIRGQKLNDAAKSFIESLRSQASIKYFVNYEK